MFAIILAFSVGVFGGFCVAAIFHHPIIEE